MNGKRRWGRYETNSMFNMHRKPRADAHGVGSANSRHRPDRAKAHRTANVRATKPANTGAMTGAHHHSATAPSRQQTYVTPRTKAVVNQDAPIRLAEVGQGNFSSVQPFCPRCIQVIFFGAGSPVRSPPVRLTSTVSLTGKDLLRTCLMSPAIALETACTYQSIGCGICSAPSRNAILSPSRRPRLKNPVSEVWPWALA